MWHANQALTESKLNRTTTIAKGLIYRGLNLSFFLRRGQNRNIFKLRGAKSTFKPKNYQVYSLYFTLFLYIWASRIKMTSFATVYMNNPLTDYTNYFNSLYSISQQIWQLWKLIGNAFTRIDVVGRMVIQRMLSLLLRSFQSMIYLEVQEQH